MVGNKDVRRVRRACHDKEMRTLLLAAMRICRYRMTKSGVLFYSEGGECISAHLTASDHRATENLRTMLRSNGITIEKGK